MDDILSEENRRFVKVVIVVGVVVNVLLLAADAVIFLIKG